MLTRRVSLVIVATVGVACSTSNGGSPGSDANGNSSSGNNENGSSSGSQGNGSYSNGGQNSSNPGSSQTGGSGTSNTGGNSSPGNSSGTNGNSSASGGGQTSSGGQASNSSSSGSASSSGNTGTSAGETLPGATYITSAQGAYWKTGTTTTVTSGTTITVNDSTTYQTFNGFGGAFNEKGWTAIQALSASDQTTVLNLLFDWTNGAHFVMGRIPIGSSDYATSRYTDDDTSGDYSMTDFSITRDKQSVIPYVQAALAVNSGIQLWASPWTPPPWMKQNGTGSGSSGDTSAYDGGTMSSDSKTLTAFALYESMWISAYEAMNLHISQLMPQNEPNYAQTYPSCLWAPSTYDTFVAQYLGPEIASKNPNTQVYLGTMSCNALTCTTGDSNTDATVVATTTADATAMKYLHGFGFQWNEIADIPNVTKYNMPIWQTEHRAGNYPWGGENTILNVGSSPATITFNGTTAPNDLDYAIESFGLIGQWLQQGVNTYSAWNMVLDTAGLSLDQERVWPQNALITVNTSSKTYTATPAYYVFRHFSQYVAAGATRVATSGGNGITSYAFKNPDGSHAVIMYNSGSSAATETISVGGKMIQVSIPGTGFATLKT